MDNKKYNQIIDEAYENYLNNFEPNQCPPNLDVQPDYYNPMSKEWFIKSAKEKGLRGKEFSEKWGLKIEERELSEIERIEMIQPFGMDALVSEARKKWMEKNNIPTKLITITYNNEKIEIYE